MVLVIDVGNTRIKAAVFEQDRLIESLACMEGEAKSSLTNLLQKHPAISVIVHACVGNSIDGLLQDIVNAIPVIHLNAQSVFPFVNLYSTPSTLGIDRLILATGAVVQYPDQNRLIIDAGTCITYDFVNQKNEYLGGAISPGIAMRYKALHDFTAQLPLLEKKYPDQFIGNSTAESMHAGVIQGVLHEIEGTLADYESLGGNFIIILTGGDAEFLANRLKNTIFANSNFLLEALNQTYQYQTQND